MGTNVLVAQYYGAGDTKALRESVHTSILASLIFGCLVLVIGVSLAAPMLELMGTPAEVLDQACLYMRIYFIGMPASMLYNFGAAILRAVGDTQRPLYFLFLAGVVNVVLNLFCVIVLGMGVEGVAIPTVISQCVSAGLVLLCLVKAHTAYQVDLKSLCLKKDKLWGMARIGLPAGIQGCSFSISNVLIQSSINSFGSLAMAGKHRRGEHRGLCLHRPGRLCPGGPELHRPERGGRQAQAGPSGAAPVHPAGAVRGPAFGVGAYLLGPQLLGIYSTDPEVIAFGMIRMGICCVFQCIGGLMGVMVGVLRGMGYSLVPMAITIGFVCGFRVIWIFTIFVGWHTLESLYVSYPITWGLAALCDGICFFVVNKHLKKKLALAKEKA